MGPGVGIRQGEVFVMGGELISQFFGDDHNGSITHGTQVTLAGDGKITLMGPDNPLPHGATIDIMSTDATLQFDNETPVEFINEHLSKISVFGAAAEIGSQFDALEEGDNLMIENLGASGAVITAVPEPAVVVLMAFLPLLAGIRCRKIRHYQSRRTPSSAVRKRDSEPGATHSQLS